MPDVRMNLGRQVRIDMLTINPRRQIRGLRAFAAATICACASVACGGSQESVVLEAAPTLVTPGGSTTLSWRSTNQSTCAASGGWTGVKAGSGSQATEPLTTTTRFTLACTGPGGSGVDAAIVGIRPPDSPFPVHVEAGKRHLIDARGRPFFVHGDTPWSLIVQLNREQVDQYLEDRRAQGFNTILVNLIEHEFAEAPPNNEYGQGPFEVPGDFSSPSDAYFDHAEYVVAKAAEKNILVMLTPAYMGYGGGSQGWYRDMRATGESKLRNYGRFVANRFRAYDNILWVHGGDFNPPERSLLRAVANGILDVDKRWLHTFHGSRGTSALGYLGNSEPWLTVNSIYADENTVVAEALREHARSSMPFFLIEARYEHEGGSTEATIRAQAYQAVLSGGAGHLMGNKPVWKFDRGWQSAMGSPGARTLSHLRSLFESVSWWTLRPDADKTLLTKGAGERADQAVAARASDGAFALVYVPSARTLTVNLGKLAGPSVRARWYDPTAGSYTILPGSPFRAAGSMAYASPGHNTNGFGDWVLVLESTH